jgi:thioredoxin 1
MPYIDRYVEREPTRAEIDGLLGFALIEFGAPWCPHCIAAQAPIEHALATHEGASDESIVHEKIEDGPGRPLGRSFRVKLWPTLILMRDGVEVARIVRPTQADEIVRILFSHT